nr:hypothetical protein 5 [bacterium]
MNQKELQLLLDAAQKIGVNPTTLKPVNPFQMKGSVAESIRVAAAEIDPVQSAAWAAEAGVGESLAAAAFKAGLTRKSLAVHEELLANDPAYVEAQSAAATKEEQELLDRMEQGRKALAAKREAATKQFSKHDRVHAGGTIASSLPTDHYRSQG